MFLNIGECFLDSLLNQSVPAKTMGEFDEYRVYEFTLNLQDVITVIAKVDGYYEEDGSALFMVLEFDSVPMYKMRESIEHWNEVAQNEQLERMLDLTKGE